MLGVGKEKKLLLSLYQQNVLLKSVSSEEIQQELAIGRSETCDWCLPADDLTVSRVHARIVRAKGRLTIESVPREHGGGHTDIRIAGKSIERHVLRDKDKISLGDMTIVVETQRKGGRQAGRRRSHAVEQLNGKRRGKLFELKGQEDNIYVIGKGADAFIACDDEELISHRHAELIIKDDGSCWLRNLGGMNGVSVNGEPLSKDNSAGRKLFNGQIISLANIDFCFHDKDSVNVKPNFVLMAIAAVCTILLGVALYFFYLSQQPTAYDLIGKARHYAKAEKFDEARLILKQTNQTRDVDIYADEIDSLNKSLGIWKKTQQDWRKVKEYLEGYKWISANKLLLPLLDNRQENWNWNDDGIAQKKIAIVAARQLETMLKGRDMISNPAFSLEQLRQAKKTLTECVEVAQQDACLVKLREYIQDILAEITFTLESHERLEQMLQLYHEVADIVKVLSQCKQLNEEITVHNAQREKGGQRYSNRLVTILKTYIPAMEALRQVYAILENNLDEAAKLEFGTFQKDLHLPEQSVCSVLPILSECRHDMEVINQKLEGLVNNLERAVDALAKSDIANGKRPEVISRLTNEATWKKVLKYECIKVSLKKWTWNRNEPLDEYDAVLGIELCRDFLSAINEEQPTEFEMPDDDESKFVPQIVRLRQAYQTINYFLAFMKHPMVKMLLERPVPENRLQTLSLWVVQLQDERRHYAERLMKASRAEKKDRNALVLGAAAMMMVDDATKSFAKDYERLAKIYKRNRAEVERLWKAGGTPEDMLENVQAIRDIGLPGDPYLKRAKMELDRP